MKDNLLKPLIMPFKAKISPFWTTGILAMLFLTNPQELKSEPTNPAATSSHGVYVSEKQIPVFQNMMHSRNDPKTSQTETSIDFLLDRGSTLRVSTGVLSEAQIQQGKKGISPNEKKHLIVNLISEQCETKGNPERGTTECNRIYTDDSKIQLREYHERKGAIYKEQTLITELNDRGDILNKRTIRQKIEYGPLNKQESELKVKEWIDVVHRPQGAGASREILIYEYHRDSETPKKITWAQYDQIEETEFASLKFHVVLAYDKEGNPLKGIADQWKDGKKIDRLFQWRRSQHGLQQFDPSIWQRWELHFQQISQNSFLHF